MSVVTSAPLYAGNLGWVMEGNNYFSVDGKEKAFNYLGTEDAFTFSHGFVRTWVGQHGGITHAVHKGLQPGADTAELSIFRMHDHMPVRFEKSFGWSINWQYETMFAWPQYWRRETVPDGGWVDYAAVTYWYMNSPAGYDHEPLARLRDAQRLTIRHRENIHQDAPGGVFHRLFLCVTEILTVRIYGKDASTEWWEHGD